MLVAVLVLLGAGRGGVAAFHGGGAAGRTVAAAGCRAEKYMSCGICALFARARPSRLPVRGAALARSTTRFNPAPPSEAWGCVGWRQAVTQGPSKRIETARVLKKC